MTAKAELNSEIFGTEYGDLTVIEETVHPTRPGTFVICDCSCGRYGLVKRWYDLRVGRTKSCGHRKSDAALNATKLRNEPGHSSKYPVEYNRWKHMMNRCYNATNPDYPRYGGRGITVNEFWHDFMTWYNYMQNVLGPCPPGHSMDRVDNDRGYTPGNVVWSSQAQQVHNQERHIKKHG